MIWLTALGSLAKAHWKPLAIVALILAGWYWTVSQYNAAMDRSREAGKQEQIRVQDDQDIAIEKAASEAARIAADNVLAAAQDMYAAQETQTAQIKEIAPHVTQYIQSRPNRASDCLTDGGVQLFNQLSATSDRSSADPFAAD